jgi:hypothetical protein
MSGIWDVMSNQMVVDFVRRHLTMGMTIDAVCEALLDACVARNLMLEPNGGDNMTAVILGFLPPSESTVVDECKAAWYARFTDDLESTTQEGSDDAHQSQPSGLTESTSVINSSDLETASFMAASASVMEVAKPPDS